LPFGIGLRLHLLGCSERHDLLAYFQFLLDLRRDLHRTPQRIGLMGLQKLPLFQRRQLLLKESLLFCNHLAFPEERLESCPFTPEHLEEPVPVKLRL